MKINEINKKLVKETLLNRKLRVVVSGHHWYDLEKFKESFRYETFNKRYKKNLREIDEVRRGSTDYLHSREKEAERMTIYQLGSIDVDLHYYTKVVYGE